MTDYELVKFQHEHVTANAHDGIHIVKGCQICMLLGVLMRLRKENEDLRDLVDRMTSGLRHKG